MKSSSKLPPLPAISTHFFNNTKASTILFSGISLESGGEYHIPVIPRKGIEITMAVLIDPKKNLTAMALGPYEAAMLDAIYTLSVCSCPRISVEMLVRAMYGKRDMDVTSKQAEVLRTCLERLTGITVRIDCSAEFTLRKKAAKGEEVIYEGPLLPLQRCDDGTYVITGTSPVYAYAEAIRQIATVPAEIVQADGLRNNEETMLLRRYLLKRIAVMQNTHNHMASNKIALSRWDRKSRSQKGLLPSLYNQAEYTNWRKKKSKICHSIRAVLAGLQSVEYIAGYKEFMQGREITAYQIELEGGDACGT